MIELQHLGLKRGAFSLRGVNLKIEQGECFVVVGPSGAGKTLLMESILGVHRPNAGRVLVDGQDVTDLPPEQRGFSYVPQDLALFPHLGVRDNIAFSRQHRAPHAEVVRAVREAASWLGIEHLLERRTIGHLSGGEKQRVAIARALVAAPRALFLDEPFNSLDTALRLALYRELGDLRRRMGLTTMLVTHDHDEAFAFGDRMGVMMNGQIVQTGAPCEVYQRPATVDVARLLLVENILQVESVRPGRTPGTSVYRAAGLDIEAPARDGLPSGQGLRVGFRAHHVRMHDGSSPVGAPCSNRFGVQIRRVVPLAGRKILEVIPADCPGPLLQIAARDADSDIQYKEEEHLTIDLPQEHVLLFDEQAPRTNPIAGAHERA
jgi:molybdate/tungstate transport system ATP-binding protein